MGHYYYHVRAIVATVVAVISLLRQAAITTNAFSIMSQHHLVLVSGRTGTSTRRRNFLKMVDNDAERNTEETEKEGDTKRAATTPGRYDVTKLVGGQSADGEDGPSGFNQFDPVLSTTSFLSRRFGIVGGLAVFAGLALVEGREIYNGFQDATPVMIATPVTTTTSTGLKIKETQLGKSGFTPLPGYIIGLKVLVRIDDKVIYQTIDGEKPVAFKYGQRPFQNVICEGVEEGIKGMKVGGKRILEIPSTLAPAGVELPPNVPLTYEVELTEVLSGYF